MGMICLLWKATDYFNGNGGYVEKLILKYEGNKMCLEQDSFGGLSVRTSTIQGKDGRIKIGYDEIEELAKFLQKLISHYPPCPNCSSNNVVFVLDGGGRYLSCKDCGSRGRSACEANEALRNWERGKYIKPLIRFYTEYLSVSLDIDSDSVDLFRDKVPFYSTLTDEGIGAVDVLEEIIEANMKVRRENFNDDGKSNVGDVLRLTALMIELTEQNPKGRWGKV